MMAGTSSLYDDTTVPDTMKIQRSGFTDSGGVHGMNGWPLHAGAGDSDSAGAGYQAAKQRYEKLRVARSSDSGQMQNAQDLPNWVQNRNREYDAVG